MILRFRMNNIAYIRGEKYYLISFILLLDIYHSHSFLFGAGNYGSHIFNLSGGTRRNVGGQAAYQFNNSIDLRRR